MIRIEHYYQSVPLSISSSLSITIIDHDCYIGQIRTDNAGSFLRKLETDVIPGSALAKLPKALSSVLNHFLDKEDYTVFITDTIVLEGKNNASKMYSTSTCLEIPLNSAKKTIAIFQKIANLMLYSRCIGSKEAIGIQELSIQLASTEDHGERVFSNWTLKMIQETLPESDKNLLNTLLGMKEYVKIATRFESLYTIG